VQLLFSKWVKNPCLNSNKITGVIVREVGQLVHLGVKFLFLSLLAPLVILHTDDILYSY
jgi:hypothetical protein